MLRKRKCLKEDPETEFMRWVIKTKGGWIACKYFRLPYRSYFDGMEIDQKVKVVGQVSYYRNQLEVSSSGYLSVQ